MSGSVGAATTSCCAGFAGVNSAGNVPAFAEGASWLARGASGAALVVGVAEVNVPAAGTAFGVSAGDFPLVFCAAIACKAS
jgi:hypothetical protein